jgi:hypothetical protein
MTNKGVRKLLLLRGFILSKIPNSFDIPSERCEALVPDELPIVGAYLSMMFSKILVEQSLKDEVQQ